MKIPVLLVDDDVDDLFALEASLEPLGLEIVKAETGDEALRLILQRDFAIVVTDLLMPGMNGFELCSLIRTRDRSRELPVVILTGFDEEQAKELPGYREGAFEFMRKPVLPETLRARVAESAARFSARPEATLESQG